MVRGTEPKVRLSGTIHDASRNVDAFAESIIISNLHDAWALFAEGPCKGLFKSPNQWLEYNASKVSPIRISSKDETQLFFVSRAAYKNFLSDSARS